MRKVRDFRLPRWPVTQWIIIALMMVAITALMHEVRDLKQQIRQANYSAVVSNLRAALIERWVETQVLPQETVGANVTLFNPMRLLKQVPDNYLGGLSEAPKGVKDVWFFNSKQNCLIYIDASGKQILHPLIRGNVTKGMLGELDIRPAFNKR